MSRQPHDVVIIGAGPGGLAAARECVRRGGRPVVLDEQVRPGGQIWRQPPPSLDQGRARFGAGYQQGLAEANALRSLPGIDWRFGTAVWSVLTPEQTGEAAFRISTTCDDCVDEITARRLIVATGCYDMPVPFPGWTLPGVMGAGAIQAMMKGQRVMPGDRVVLAGSHPLLLIVAEQMLAFGAPPAQVVFSQRLTHALGLLRRPAVALRFAPTLMQAAKAMARLVRARVPVAFGSAVVAAEGEGGVQSVSLARLTRAGLADGADLRRIGCDLLGVGFGFTASAEIARLAGAEMRWSAQGGGWIAAHDGAMRSSVPGLYVAGEIAGIGGAHTAAAEGRLAALSALVDAGVPIGAADLRRAGAARRRSRAFAEMLARLSDPGAALLRSLRDDHTILCRCEGTTMGELEAVLRQNPFLGTSDAVKLLARPGMGPCQARYCGRTLAETIAETTGRRLEEVGPPRVRAPIKPVPLGQFRQPASGEGR